ncbi:DoxX family protein [Microbulbifer harenosus]|uniref:DoxX family protein n=1 Tax=Microbulbifer harenosus TaxID=2576840 RepID=A0ABY2UIA1_9GAMM|nr:MULTISPECIES: DoxX family protein [Microbulbifer]QIL88970.1 hypothetical protein GNX18_03720 [Microbulbifer sp. SH-1]TLM77704.1 hypothetical protein FDY93_08900 [Microbulbifer harenosus]
MNIFLWVLQVLLALHTATGAVWKFSNTAQSVPSLGAIPHGAWLALGVVELILSLCLVLPAFYKPLAVLVPIAAVLIAMEMLLFCALHFASGEAGYSSVVYWLVVAAIAGVIAYGRFVLKPH